jgi:hypothetical protein
MKIRPLAGALGLSALAVGGAYGQVPPRGGEMMIPESIKEDSERMRTSIVANSNVLSHGR